MARQRLPGRRKGLFSRTEVLADLRAEFGDAPFASKDIDELVHWLNVFKREPWTRESIRQWRKAEQPKRREHKKWAEGRVFLERALRGRRELRDEVLRLYDEQKPQPPWGIEFFGEQRARKPETVMARRLGALLLAAQGSDALAGRKPRRSFGDSDSASIRLLRRWLGRCLPQAQVPKSENLRRILLRMQREARQNRT